MLKNDTIIALSLCAALLASASNALGQERRDGARTDGEAPAAAPARAPGEQGDPGSPGDPGDPGARTRAPSSRLTNPDEALIEKLQTTIADVDIEREDFDRVVSRLRETYDLNVHVSWDKLDAVGVRRDQRLQLHLQDVPLATVLDVILAEASPPGPDRLAYQIDGGVIMISTDLALERNRITRVYDVTDLIESGYATRRFFNTPILTLNLTGREALGGETIASDAPGPGRGAGGGGGFSPFDDPDETPAVARMERVNELVELIVDVIATDTWTRMGGTVGSIHARGHLLIVRQTLNNHRELEHFLRTLRAMEPAPLNAEAAIVRVRTDRARAIRDRHRATFPRLSEEAFDELLDGEETSVLFRGVTSGRNGERLWFSALTQRDLAASTEAEVEANAWAYEPLTAFATEGLELIALPLLEPNGDSMTLDVQMAWVPAATIREKSVTPGPNAEPMTIEPVTRSMRTVSTTTTLRVGDALALSIPREVPANQSAVEWEDWLIVRVGR